VEERRRKEQKRRRWQRRSCTANEDREEREREWKLLYLELASNQGDLPLW